MNGVIDCSAAVEIVMQREKADILDTKQKSCSWIFVPDFFRVEIANVLWKNHRFGNLSVAGIETARTKADELPSEYVSCKELIAEALQESIRLNHPVYDMLYLVLAKRRNAVLLTLDKQLRNLAERQGIDVFPAQPADIKTESK